MSRGSALPPVSLWSALFLGGCFGAWSEEKPGYYLSFALVPFVLTTLVTALMSVGPHPSAVAMGRAFGALSTARWFWLGYLTLSSQGLFRPDGLVETQPLLLSSNALVGCVGALALLHWASRTPRAIDLERFSGPTESLRADYQRNSLFCIQELWLLMPAVIMAAVVSQLRLDNLAPYVLLSAASAALMTWSVEDRAASRAGAGDVVFRWLSKAAAGGLVLALPFLGQLRLYFMSFQLPVVWWLIATGLAIVSGRPWSATPASTAVEETPREALPFKFSLQGALLGLLTLAILGAALRGGLPLPGRDAALVAARSELAKSFGHQARLARVGGEALLVGCNLDVARLSLAAEIVSNHLPDDSTRVVSVRTRRWERVGLFFLAFTVAVFLVFPAYGLTFASPGPASRPYFIFCAALGGANGAFAIGSALGWFWIDPMPHLAAFLLSTSLSWLGLGYARAWLDSRVSTLSPRSPEVRVVARNT